MVGDVGGMGAVDSGWWNWVTGPLIGTKGPATSDPIPGLGGCGCIADRQYY